MQLHMFHACYDIHKTCNSQSDLVRQIQAAINIYYQAIMNNTHTTKATLHA